MEELHQAIRDGHAELACNIINNNPQLALESDEAGWTALHIASSLGNVLVVQQLLPSLSKSVNAQTKGGQTALHYAASKGHVEVIRLLLMSSKQPSITLLQDKQGWTAMHRAAAIGHHAALSVLLTHFPGDLNGQDVEGNSALHIACQEMHASCIKVLLQAGAAVDNKNGQGKTPIDCIDPKNTELCQLFSH